jgi:aspartate/methionine/tyrosine aminotransferase
MHPVPAKESVDTQLETPTDWAAKRYPFATIRERLRRHDGDVLDFAFGRYRLAPPDDIRGYVAGHGDRAYRRASSADLDRFAEAAAEMLARDFGTDVSPECILPAPSGRLAITALTTCLLAPGQGVLVTEPGYPAFAYLAARRGLAVRAVSLSPADRFAPDVAGLADAAVDAIALAALNYPNNPTGAVLSSGIVSLLRERFREDLLLFNDATYASLSYDVPPGSLLAHAAAVGCGGHAIELHSFSKLFGLGPLAIALLVGPSPLTAQVRRYSEFAWPPLSSLHVETATRCAQSADHLNAMRAFFHQRITDLRVVLGDLGFGPYPTPGGMYVLCRTVSAVGGRAVSNPQEAAERLLDAYGLAAVPWNTPDGGYLRFAALYRPEDLTGLRKLGRAGPIVSA